METSAYAKASSANPFFKPGYFMVKKSEGSREKCQITFRSIATKASIMVGSSATFFFALFLIFLWGISGFYFGFANTWQLMINTGTTICTFIIVILVQNTQTRESRSIQLELDQLLYGTDKT